MPARRVHLKAYTWLQSLKARPAAAVPSAFTSYTVVWKMSQPLNRSFAIDSQPPGRVQSAARSWLIGPNSVSTGKASDPPTVVPSPEIAPRNPVPPMLRIPATEFQVQNGDSKGP